MMAVACNLQAATAGEGQARGKGNSTTRGAPSRM